MKLLVLIFLVLTAPFLVAKDKEPSLWQCKFERHQTVGIDPSENYASNDASISERLRKIPFNISIFDKKIVTDTNGFYQGRVFYSIGRYIFSEDRDWTPSITFDPETGVWIHAWAKINSGALSFYKCYQFND